MTLTSFDSRKYLNSFINYEFDLNAVVSADFKLVRVKKLIDLLVPDRHSLTCVHVAGSVGKGSTCAFAASILKSVGYKVGLYTSPHLFDYTERIRVLGGRDKIKKENSSFPGKISEEELSSLVEDAYPAIERIKADPELGRLTFFEIYTALAFFHFYRSKVDCVILETGLGGRLDATNAVDSLVSGITPISLEHTNILGTTIEEIAGEKAAIIKNAQQAVIVAPQDPHAARVIKDRCDQTGAQAYWLGKDIQWKVCSSDINGQVVNVKSVKGDYKGLRVHLLGEHQAVNAAMAIGLVESLESFRIEVDSKAVYDGIKDVAWPGRFEVIKKEPYIVLDGAHNPVSCGVLIETLKKIFPGKKAAVVLGVSNDKDHESMCRTINKIANRVILTKADHPRARNFSKEGFREFFDPAIDVVTTENIKEAMSAALSKLNKDDVLVVTGSLFIIGEARTLCQILTKNSNDM